MVLVGLRHAQSIFNVTKRSRPDCGLSAEGVRQAKLLKGVFAYVVCSPLVRTRRTLELSSITYGNIEYEELARERRDDICDFLPSEPGVKETHIDFATRMKKLDERLRSLERAHPQVLLVAHAYVLIALQRLRSGLRLPLDNDEAQAIGAEYGEDSTPNARLFNLPYGGSSTDYQTGRGDGANSECQSTILP